MDRILGAIVAIVLGLVAIAGIGVAANTAYSNNKASQVVTDIAQLEVNARGLFSGSGTGYANFTTANATALINAGMVPTTMVKNNAIYDQWGNTVTLESASTNSAGVITFGGGGSENVKECVQVTQQLKDYSSLKVGGTTFSSSNPPDPVSSAQACAGGTTIALTFE